MRWLKSSVLLGLLLAALAWPASVLAGGWSVVVPDPLPPDITADADTTIGFTVLQHGRRPLSGQTPKEAIHESGERVAATATGAGAPGHYVATLRFSQPGAWSWSVDVFEGPHMMAPITVKDAGAVTASGGSAGQTAEVPQPAALQPVVPLVAGGWLPLAGAGAVIALVIALVVVGLGFGRRARGRLAGPPRT